MGDSIVPLEAAHLPGDRVERVTLEDATHSIGSPDSWYGSDAVVDDWLPQARRALARQGGAGGAGLSYAAIKKLGVAGTLAYILTELAFWLVAFPLAATSYYQAFGHWPDVSTLALALTLALTEPYPYPQPYPQTQTLTRCSTCPTTAPPCWASSSPAQTSHASRCHCGWAPPSRLSRGSTRTSSRGLAWAPAAMTMRMVMELEMQSSKRLKGYCSQVTQVHRYYLSRLYLFSHDSRTSSEMCVSVQ